MRKLRIISLSLLFLFSFNLAFAENCDEYPGQVGIPVFDFDENGNFKLMFTQGSEVAFDDFDLVQDSLRIAEAEAKVAFAEFMEEMVAKSCNDGSVSSQTATYSLSGKEVDLEKVKTSVCELGTRTEALLRGALPIGNCYDPGKKVLVTIGIKQDFIDGAEAVRSAMNDSFLRTGGAGISLSVCASEDSDDCEVEEGSKAKVPLNKTLGFSNTKNIKKF